MHATRVPSHIPYYAINSHTWFTMIFDLSGFAAMDRSCSGQTDNYLYVNTYGQRLIDQARPPSLQESNTTMTFLIRQDSLLLDFSIHQICCPSHCKEKAIPALSIFSSVSVITTLSNKSAVFDGRFFTTASMIL